MLTTISKEREFYPNFKQHSKVNSIFKISLAVVISLYLKFLYQRPHHHFIWSCPFYIHYCKDFLLENLYLYTYRVFGIYCLILCLCRFYSFFPYSFYSSLEKKCVIKRCFMHAHFNVGTQLCFVYEDIRDPIHFLIRKYFQNNLHFQNFEGYKILYTYYMILVACSLLKIFNRKFGLSISLFIPLLSIYSSRRLMLLILPKRKIHEIRLEKRIFSIKLLPKSRDWGKGNTNRFTDKLF